MKEIELGINKTVWEELLEGVAVGCADVMTVLQLA